MRVRDFTWSLHSPRGRGNGQADDRAALKNNSTRDPPAMENHPPQLWLGPFGWHRSDTGQQRTAAISKSKASILQFRNFTPYGSQ